MGRTTINVSDDVAKKFLRIRAERQQDNSMSETLEHIIYVYEEQKFKPEKHIITGNVSSPTDVKKV